MIKFKLATLATTAALLLCTQAHASDAKADRPQAMPEAVFSQTDINAMFDQTGRPMQLATLSVQEMKATEGAFMNFAIGAGVGLTSYVVMASATDTPMTWQGAAFSAGVGALTGGFGTALIGASGGGIAGNVAWRPAMVATTFGAGHYRKSRGW